MSESDSRMSDDFEVFEKGRKEAESLSGSFSSPTIKLSQIHLCISMQAFSSVPRDKDDV